LEGSECRGCACEEGSVIGFGKILTKFLSKNFDALFFLFFFFFFNLNCLNFFEYWCASLNQQLYVCMCVYIYNGYPINLIQEILALNLVIFIYKSKID